MRWISSDLIIAPTPLPACALLSASPSNSIAPGTLPNGQHAVKRCARLSCGLERGGEWREARGAQDGRGEAEDAELVELGLLLPVANGQLFGDALRLLEPIDRLAFAAEGVDELQGNRLPPGEDAPVGDLGELLVGEAAALLHQPPEPDVIVVDQRHNRGARRLAYRLKSVRRVLERRGFELVDLHADHVEALI